MHCPVGNVRGHDRLLLFEQVHGQAYPSYTERALVSMKNMTGKQERKARPRIILGQEGKKRASAGVKPIWILTMPRLARITPVAVPTCGFRKSTGTHTDTCIHMVVS